MFRRRRPAHVLRDDDGVVVKIILPTIYSASDYAVALHEFGHVHGRYQKAGTMASEYWAWQWARENAIVWTAEMEHVRQMSLQDYWQTRSLGKLDVPRTRRDAFVE